MLEFRRIYGKKTLMLFFLLMIINIGIFIFGANPNKEITLTGELLDEYIAEYPEFLNKTIKQGKARTGIKLFRQGFASEVTSKSVERYEALIGTEPKVGDNRGMVLFFQSHVSELLVLFFMLHIVTSMFDERKKGLVNMVRATSGGRATLFLYRVGILIITALFGTSIMMGSNLIGVAFTFGTDDLLRPIQSLPEYQKCPYGLSILEFLIVLVLIKALAIFLVGLLMYVLKGLVNGFFFYVIMGGLVIAEVLCGLLISPVASVNLFKYINLFTVIKSEDFFNGCVYLNIFDSAVDGVKISCIVFFSLLVILGLLGFLIHGKRYAVGTKGGERLGALLGRLRERFAIQHTLLGWECYKLYIKQGAVIFIIACIGIHIQQSAKYGYYYPVPAQEKLYYISYKGEITEAKVNKAEKWMDTLKESQANYEKRLEEIENTIPFNSQRYQSTVAALNNNMDLQKAFAPVLEDLRNGYKYTLETGKSVSLVEPYTYDFLLNRDVQTRQRAAFLSIAAIIGALAGIFAFERHTNMEQTINSTYRGRKIALVYKPVLIFLTSFSIPVIISLVQMININKNMAFPDLDQAVQGMRYLNDFGIYMSLKSFFIFLLVLRGLFGVLIGTITAVLSRLGDDKFVVICRVTIVIVIWLFLAELVPGLEFLSPINLLGYTWV